MDNTQRDSLWREVCEQNSRLQELIDQGRRLQRRRLNGIIRHLRFVRYFAHSALSFSATSVAAPTIASNIRACAYSTRIAERQDQAMGGDPARQTARSDRRDLRGMEQWGGNAPDVVQVTTPANTLISRITDRMPAILPRNMGHMVGRNGRVACGSEGAPSDI